MCGPKRFWMFLIVIGVIALTGGCTENNLDESDADVFLEVIGFDAGPVTPGATTGVCSLDPSITCLENSTCSLQSAGNCDLSAEILCELPTWKYDFEVNALNEGAQDTPLNDVEIVSVDVVYSGGALTIAPRTLNVGVVIPSDGFGAFEFVPINANEITSDETFVNLDFTWNARTVGGQDVIIFGGQGNTLQILDCLP